MTNELKAKGNYNKVLKLISSGKNKGREFVFNKLMEKYSKKKENKNFKNLINLLKQCNKKTLIKFYKLYHPNILSLDLLLKYIFEKQIENKLLIITFLVFKKINEKGFMEELVNNYGVFLDTDNFIKLMKQKIDEIKSYKQLFEFIGSDFGKNDDEIEILLKAYKKAKAKGYLKQLNV